MIETIYPNHWTTKHGNLYSVYDKNDQPVAICATSRECAKAMKVTMNSFYSIFTRFSQGKVKRKWKIYPVSREEMEGDDE